MTTTITAVQGTQIRHGMLIDLEINTQTYYISNLYTSITYAGHDYTQLGHFMGVTDIPDDLRPTNNQITVTLSGIPPDDGSTNYMNIALNSNLKGSKIKIYRAFFDLTNGALMTNQVYQRFNGYVSNYSLNENWDQENRVVSNSISIQCSSVHAILERQFSGRRTNEKDQQYWFTGDTGMYKIKSVADSQFDFGKPFTAPASTTPAE